MRSFTSTVKVTQTLTIFTAKQCIYACRTFIHNDVLYVELTIDASDRLSGFFVIVPSVRIMASFPDIISKRTTPKA